jgi:hypothetical protein
MTALLLQFWPYLLGAAALVFGALKVSQSGVNAERLRQAEREAKARDIRDEVQSDVGAMSPDHVRSELAKRASK